MNRSRLSRGFAATIAAGAAVLMAAGTAQAQDIESITDEYLYDVSLNEFVEIRAQQPYPDQLDWSADSCTWSPDEPLGWDFSQSCNRHDFGYRNYKNQGRFNDGTRLQIDDNFKADMYGACANDGACEKAADLYYWAVRTFGDMTASTADAVEKARVTKTTDASGAVEAYTAVDRNGEPVEFRVTN